MVKPRRRSALVNIIALTVGSLALVPGSLCWDCPCLACSGVSGFGDEKALSGCALLSILETGASSLCAAQLHRRSFLSPTCLILFVLSFHPASTLHPPIHHEQLTCSYYNHHLLAHIRQASKLWFNRCFVALTRLAYPILFLGVVSQLQLFR